MDTVEITIGWTINSHFQPFVPGSPQHRVTIEVEDTDGDFAQSPVVAAEVWREACFEATNAPFATGRAAKIADAIAAAGYHGHEAGHYSLSVGDTVTIGEVTFACDRFGWSIVSEGVNA